MGGLQLVANNAIQSVNARGVVLEVCLYNIQNRAMEIALHGVRHGVVVMLAAAQVWSGHELWLLPHGFLAIDHPEDHEDLVEDFRDEANTVAFISLAKDIVNKVFLGP